MTVLLHIPLAWWNAVHSTTNSHIVCDTWIIWQEYNIPGCDKSVLVKKLFSDTSVGCKWNWLCMVSISKRILTSTSKLAFVNSSELSRALVAAWRTRLLQQKWSDSQKHRLTINIKLCNHTNKKETCKELVFLNEDALSFVQAALYLYTRSSNYRVRQKKVNPCRILWIFQQRIGIFARKFTRLFIIHIYV